jgi:hypothetical protein
MPTLFAIGANPDLRWIGISVVGPASYVTGGFDPGFPSVGAPVLIVGDVQGGFFLQGDYANKKVKVFWCAGSGAAAVEVTAATNLSGTTFRVVAAWKE